jgi:type VI secretion system secreted protein Hcp
MAIDAFLWFTGGSTPVEGETTDRKMKDKKAFEINSYSFGVENVATIGSKAGGAGGGKANFDQFEFTKNIDAGSCPLFANCCKGTHFTDAVLGLRRSGGTSEGMDPYLKFTFKFVYITGVKWSGSGDDVPEETITFAFGAMEVAYQAQNEVGAAEGSPAVVSWSQVLNKAVLAVK